MRNKVALFLPFYIFLQAYFQNVAIFEKMPSLRLLGNILETVNSSRKITTKLLPQMKILLMDLVIWIPHTIHHLMLMRWNKWKVFMMNFVHLFTDFSTFWNVYSSIFQSSLQPYLVLSVFFALKYIWIGSFWLTWNLCQLKNWMGRFPSVWLSKTSNVSTSLSAEYWYLDPYPQ